MTEEITKLDSPIDVMYLIHKALRAEAARVERMSEKLTVGEDLQPFQKAFQRWVRVLGYHAAAEDQHMTPPLTDSPAARDNEAAHQALEARLVDIQHYLTAEMGARLSGAKLQRHLYGKVVALRIAQDDHLEEEEAFVLPMIRQRIPEAEQVKMARHLLIDIDGPDERWIIEWVAGDLTTTERQLLTDLTVRLKQTYAKSYTASGG